MSTETNDEWIERSEREPKDIEYPVWLYTPGGVPSYALWPFGLGGWTHWKTAPNPPPPPKPKEKTQRELDQEALDKTALDANCWGREQTWFAALAYRDRQNAEDLIKLPRVMGDHSADDRLRKRCGLNK